MASRGQSLAVVWAWRCAGVAGSLVVVCALLAAAPSAAKRQKVVSPHWQADGCKSCHTMEAGRPLPIPPAQGDDVCVKCHDGEKAAAEFHPVDRNFEARNLVKPEKWPLIEGRLVCLTCHDMKIGCDVKAVRPVGNRMVLRDFQAGRSKGKPFCLNCHKEGAYQKINPHAMLLDDGQIIDEKCLFCHTRPMDRNTMKRTGDPSLKAAQVVMCKDCHPTHKDPMQQGHIGLQLSADTLAHMYVVENMGLSAKIAPQIVEQAKKAGSKPSRMVPDRNGQMVCSTCHNPHESGVFPPGSDLGYRAMKINYEGKLVSPVRGQTWCRHCHDF